ncbi:hypothetical protein M440DRAFT_1466320 [Trichoderma longibrachiatum ATCC 18648]|uniref:GOLD domain-containing protein n=1 Tax=Trichoderma longibrachiatum ATCC 18648 TaxID=983965 RepID=A0A2T4BPX4_TRILO|nr:hypothetical protein M440DRAFT_1466320 [Trichoderma longibrachiatum ATCC 18648]
MRFSPALAALLGATLAEAQFLISELSFGYAGRISPAENPGHIPNFIVSGQPSMPEILSSKVILTPVAPGNARGAIWSEQPLLHSNWIVDRHAEVKELFASLQSKLALLDQLAAFQQRIVALENEVRNMNSELQQKIAANERAVHGALRTHHMSLTQRVTESVPGHGRLIAVIVGTQVVLVAAYVLYKRKKANSPKKYL